MPAGRPTKYTKALGTKICRRIAEGETLRSICASSTMPSKSTLLLWVVDDEHREFSDQYMRAREAAGYSHADGIIQTVQDVQSETLKPDQARVMIDGLKWAAERMAPKTHSPRQALDHSSSDGSMTPKAPTLAAFYGDADE